jgi:hypothetical protein
MNSRLYDVISDYLEDNSKNDLFHIVDVKIINLSMLAFGVIMIP